MRKRIVLAISLLLALVAVALAADWRSAAFDSIIPVSPTVLPPTHNWSDTCSHLAGAPTLFYGNSPEGWNTTNWSSQDHVILAKGMLSPPMGLIGFHYQNKLALPVTLNVGIDPASTATFGQITGGVSIGSASPVIEGSKATQMFLNKYVPVAGLPMATPHHIMAPNFLGNGRTIQTFSISPRQIMKWIVPVGQTISAEYFLPTLSQAATFYLYACTAHCTSTYTTVAAPDTFRQRGYFSSATYLIHYDYTPESHDTGGAAYEIISGGGCVPNLSGNDPLDPTPGAHATLVGNYAVPVDIYGAAPFSNRSQRFGITPKGGVPYVGAAWVQQLVDPKVQATISPQAYPIPTAQPTAINVNGQSAFLGYDRGGGHTIIYILPGGNSNPVWIWDYVLTPPPKPAHLR